MTSQDPQRYAPEIPFPARRYLPGTGPHPKTLPREELPVEPLVLGTALLPLGFRFGVDCFNHRYFWEAHEAWEDLWHVTPEGPARELLQGLIQVAAAWLQHGRGNGEAAGRLFTRGSTRIATAGDHHPSPAGIRCGAFLATQRNALEAGSPPPPLELDL